MKTTVLARNPLALKVMDTATCLRVAIAMERGARQALDVAQRNRRAADEAILFRFEDAAAEKAYGKNEKERQAKLRIDNASTYNAHKDAQQAHATAVSDLETARVNFEEAACLARLNADMSV